MTIRKKYSEAYLRGELRNWRFVPHTMNLLGCIYEDQEYQYPNGAHVIVRDYEMRDYRDHYIFISPDGDYYKAYKKEQRDR